MFTLRLFRRVSFWMVLAVLMVGQNSTFAALGMPCNDDRQCATPKKNTFLEICLKGKCSPGPIVQCVRNSDCSSGDICSKSRSSYQCVKAPPTSRSSSTPSCPNGKRLVKSNTIPVCSACISIKQQPTVRGPANCPPGKVFAGGYCIKKCGR